MVLGAKDTTVNTHKPCFFGAYILMRGGRQETNEHILQIVLSTLKKKHGGRQIVSESCYIRKVEGQMQMEIWEVSGTLSGKFLEKFLFYQKGDCEK